MKTIRASELSAYVFCQRAWKYQQQGKEQENQADLAAGIQLHYQHNKKLMLSSLYRVTGLVLLSAALLGLIIMGILALSINTA